MTCTRCGKPSRVTETRHPESHPRTWLGKIKQAGEVATWYTSDIVVRARSCPNGHRWNTIELSSDDLDQMVKDGKP
jgi:hypothetical protein